MQYNLDQKTIIITGANSGIGKAAAIQLASLGATVIMACRSAERGAVALEEVKMAAQSEKVELMQVDMSSLPSIHKFVENFALKHMSLDVLIHNAANFDHTLKNPTLTKVGLKRYSPPTI